MNAKSEFRQEPTHEPCLRMMMMKRMMTVVRVVRVEVTVMVRVVETVIIAVTEVASVFWLGAELAV